MGCQPLFSVFLTHVRGFAIRTDSAKAKLNSRGSKNVIEQ